MRGCCEGHRLGTWAGRKHPRGCPGDVKPRRAPQELADRGAPIFAAHCMGRGRASRESMVSRWRARKFLHPCDHNFCFRSAPGPVPGRNGAKQLGQRSGRVRVARGEFSGLTLVSPSLSLSLRVPVGVPHGHAGTRPQPEQRAGTPLSLSLERATGRPGIYIRDNPLHDPTTPLPRPRPRPPPHSRQQHLAAQNPVAFPPVCATVHPVFDPTAANHTTTDRTTHLVRHHRSTPTKHHLKHRAKASLHHPHNATLPRQHKTCPTSSPPAAAVRAT